MNHLTQEQIEDILQGAPVPDHVGACSECRALLAEQRAIAERVRRTFTSMRASSDLTQRIQAGLSHVPDSSTAIKSRPRTILLNAHRRFWSGLAAAAAVMAVAIPVAFYLNTSSQAMAAQSELVDIHKQNLESMDELFVHEDPGELVGHLESQTGHAPAMLCTGSGLSICGCCTRQFQGQSVGSYVIQTRSGPVSVVVIRDSPKSLGMTREKEPESSKRPLWRASCDGCNMASAHIGNRYYVAVGQVNQDELTHVLNNLLE